MAENTILDLDALLDTKMNEVQDVPDYVTPPTGIYMLSVTKSEVEKFDYPATKDKAAKKGTKIRIGYKVEQVVECEDSLPPAVGSLFSDNFQGTTEGLEYFKKQARLILNVKDLGDASLKDVMDGLTGISFKARVVTKTNKEGYENARVTPHHDTEAA